MIQLNLPADAGTRPIAAVVFDAYGTLLDVQSIPIRLTQTPTTCRVCPLAGIQLGVGWSLGRASDP